mgnify:CR=1 FL=1
MALTHSLPADRPVLIAGPTASGKSALALAIATAQGGVIVNADASQVFGCWRLLTARPSPDEERQAAHRLYGHLPHDADYSVGHWLRDVRPLLDGPARPIIVGGTGLYFTALTEGLAEIPPTPPAIRDAADALRTAEGVRPMIADLDPATRARIDLENPMRVQRAWEVARATGRGLAAWQDDTPPPLLPLGDCTALVVDAPKDWLDPRIERRFDAMLEGGVLDEVRAMRAYWDPTLLSCKAIGAPELMAHVSGDIPLDRARDSAIIATRRYAKRQRTWFRSKMRLWRPVSAQEFA